MMCKEISLKIQPPWIFHWK